MSDPCHVPRDEIRIANAFAAIAAQLAGDGWRMARGAHRSYAHRSWCATYRRLCDDGSVDALAVHLTDRIEEDVPDLEPFVARTVADLRARHRAWASELPEEDLGTYYTRDPELFTAEQVRARVAEVRQRAYENGLRDGRDEGAAKGQRSALEDDAAALGIAAALPPAPEVTVTTLGELMYASLILPIPLDPDTLDPLPTLQDLAALGIPADVLRTVSSQSADARELQRVPMRQLRAAFTFDPVLDTPEQLGERIRSTAGKLDHIADALEHSLRQRALGDDPDDE